jgi:hypothetical protein
MSGDLLDLMRPPMAPMAPGLSTAPGATPAAANVSLEKNGETASGRVRKDYDVMEGDGNTRRIIVTTKREIWALNELIDAGAVGCTPITRPAPRWSAYIYKLKRNHGLSIETVTEAHGGEFKGHHGRYILRSTVVAVESEVA